MTGEGAFGTRSSTSEDDPEPCDSGHRRRAFVTLRMTKRKGMTGEGAFGTRSSTSQDDKGIGEEKNNRGK